MESTRNCYISSDLKESVLVSNLTANFEERYRLGNQLGLGRFGIIRECSDKLTGEVLACKSIAKERLVTDEDIRSIRLEIEIMTKLSGHENIVDLKFVYEDEDFVHLVMELCAGGELFHRIEKQGRLSEHEARIIFKQLMEVVKYCHDKGIFHRDLKPENILLVSRSSLSPIKLADFGLATYIQPGQALNGTVGSPFYIAPEVLEGGYNQAADVWSAGVILYILLSGMPPFWGKTKSTIFDAVRTANLCFHPDIWNHISTSAKDLISGILCLDPSKRLTADQVLAHSWTNDAFLKVEEPYIQDYLSSQLLEIVNYSYSNLSLTRDDDLSFCNGSPSIINSQQGDSLVFSCRSSFSSITCRSDAEFSSPIPSLPSFTFSTPMPTLGRSDSLCSFKTKLLCDGDSSVTKLIFLPDPANPEDLKLDIVEQSSEAHVGEGTNVPTATREQNHTMGGGELVHLDDAIATESVICWAASCTQVSCATSFRSSLVC